MSSPSTYHTPEEDYRLSPDTPTRKIRIRCACGTFARNVHMIEAAVELLRRAQLPPSTAVESYWCRDCKETVKVTAKMMGIAVA